MECGGGGGIAVLVKNNCINVSCKVRPACYAFTVPLLLVCTHMKDYMGCILDTLHICVVFDGLQYKLIVLDFNANICHKFGNYMIGDAFY